MNNKINIGILTEHRARNYGSVLQNYAFVKILNKSSKGRVNTIDYRPYFIENSFGIFNIDLFQKARKSLKELLRFFLITLYKAPANILREKRFRKFRNQRLQLSENFYKTFSNLDDAINSYDVVFIGSDQVWNTDITDGFCPGYFGDFTNYQGILASYAASIGKSQIDLEQFKKRLCNFDALSVRESSAKMMLDNLTEKNIEVVLDPTLLIENSEWIELVGKPLLKQDYIFVYLLEINNKIIDIVNEFSKVKNMPIVFFDVKKRYNCKSFSRYASGPEEFLTYLYYSKYVITNSFHGTVFSIIYEKQFISIPHSTKSSRAIDLLTKLELTDRIYDETNALTKMDSEINYRKVHDILECDRRESINYIDKVLRMVER